ncbi:MAG: hypothetical protein ACTSU5_09635 [Promethearchaeota archaeon]
MPELACVGAGPITLYYSQDCPPEVEALFGAIRGGALEAITIPPVLAEAFRNLFFQAKGRSDAERVEFARGCILNFRRDVPVTFREMSTSLMLRAGEVKAKHRTTLTMNQSMMVALAINTGAVLHTTAPLVPKIEGLTVKIYRGEQ